MLDEGCRVSCWASSSRNVKIAGGTADSDVADENTTEGVQITVLVGFGRPNPPAC